MKNKNSYIDSQDCPPHALDNRNRDILKQDAPSTNLTCPVTEEVERLQRIQDKFIETVAHELRTPLTPVKSIIDLFLSGSLGELTPAQREYMQIIGRNVDRLCLSVRRVTSPSWLDNGGSK